MRCLLARFLLGWSVCVAFDAIEIAVDISRAGPGNDAAPLEIRVERVREADARVIVNFRDLPKGMLRHADRDTRNSVQARGDRSTRNDLRGPNGLVARLALIVQMHSPL